MSDSDDELLAGNNVFTLANESKSFQTVSAHGPRINVTGMSIPDNNLKSSMLNMPRNNEWRRQPGSSYDQRSMGYRRETSPMSIASACDARRRNLIGPYYSRATSSQRSVYNDRAGSPVSLRSIDSNVTMCATDIAMALKNMQFNNNDTIIIREAFNHFMKHKSHGRRRIEKRRKLRLAKLMRSHNRRKSGYDSGELGSNSSISSDDNSVRTSNYKSNKSTVTDISDFRKTIKESNMFQDRSNNFRQNRMQTKAYQSAYLNCSKASVTSTRSVIEKPTFTKYMPSVNNASTFNKNQIALTQKERFQSGFLLPSQRFNRSIAATSIQEKAEEPDHNGRNNISHFDKNKESAYTKRVPLEQSEDEEIFTNNTKVNQTKRGIDTVDDTCLPRQKKPKVVSPCKNMTQSFRSSTRTEDNNDFEFAKPTFPVKKATHLKAKEKLISGNVIIKPTEKLIQSSQLPISNTIEFSVPAKTTSQTKEVEENEDTECNLTLSSQSITNLSMKPSFIKRKLFSQTLDVTEKTHDIINSPQNSIYGSIQKEKNKARKLASSQYCLSRDIQADENNLLDLIHKIVPAEKLNATNQTKTIQNKSQDDKWDMSSIISAKNSDDMSETFTDEETLYPDHGTQSPLPAVHKTLISPIKKDVEKISFKKNVVANKPVVSKVIEQRVANSPQKVSQETQKVLVDNNGTPTKAVAKSVKSFWDTDFESDAEGTIARKNKKEENTKKEAQRIMEPAFKGFSSMFPLNKTSAVNNTTTFNYTVDKFNNSNRSLKLFSHRNTKPYTKKAENLMGIKQHFEPQCKKNQQTMKASSCIDLSMQVSGKENKVEQQENKKPDTKKLKQKKGNENNIETPNVTMIKEPAKPLKKAIAKEVSSDELSTQAKKNEAKLQDNKNIVKNQSSPKKRKTGKENNDKTTKRTTEKGLAKPEKKTLKADEFPKPRNNISINKDITTTQSKPRTNKKLPTAQDERQKLEESKTHQSKTKYNKHLEEETKPKNNKKTQTKKQTNFAKKQNTEVKQLDNTANRAKTVQNAKSIDMNQITLSDSIINNNLSTDSYNNSSLRPLRSCRISKLSKTQRSLRSSDSNSSQMIADTKKENLQIKTIAKTIKNIAQKTPVNKLKQNLDESDISFSITKESPLPKRNNKMYNTRLQNTINSDISFSINDKDTPKIKKSRGISANNMKQVSIILSPIRNILSLKNMYSKNEIKPARSKIPNRRYLS